MKKTWRAVMVGGLIVTMAACSATPVRRSFKESWQDTKIKTAVRVKLTKDKGVKARHMDINVWRGVVALDGRALNADEKVLAETLARQVKNVVAVENHLHVVGEPMLPRVATTTPARTTAASVATRGPTAPVITAPSVGATTASTTASKNSTAPKTPIAKPTAATEQQRVAAKPAAVKPVAKAVTPARTELVKEMAAPSTIDQIRPKAVISAAPGTTPRPASTGKVLPWLGEVPDEEGPTIKPTREFTERTAAPTVAKSITADEDLAREAAEELKRLKGSSAQ